MKTTKRFLLTLAAMIGMTGAWAQATDEEVAVTKSADNQWTLTMPEGNVELEIEYYATTPFDLTVGESLHGTVAFSVGGEPATQACYDDVVTVTVTPNDGYSTKDVKVRAYTSWGGAGARGFRAPSLQDEVSVTKNETNGTWSFSMPEADVWVVVSYTKNLQDSWIETIADVTYTGEAIEPVVVVKDGETTLVAGTDYTVSFANNTNPGTATVTITAVEGSAYIGTATGSFTILTNKTGLNTAITDAETYYESIKDNYPEAAAQLLTAINTAKGIQGNADATQTEIETATSNLGTVQTVVEQAVLDEAKDNLSDAITDAETYYESIKDNYPEAAAQLLAAINTAKGVQEKAGATQAEVEAALSAIGTAQTTTEQAVLNEAKNELSDAITDAETYYNSIKDSDPALAKQLKDVIDAVKGIQEKADATQTEVEAALLAIGIAKEETEEAIEEVADAKTYVDDIVTNNPEVAAELQDVIDAVNQVLNDPNATPEQIANALQMLTDAVEAAKADVQQKRIDITIPAKSYVSRVDAEKRQMKTAVSGVSFYTVASVTDSEVILSSELSVVDAEIPYLIYNDNDVEVTISIVVSENDADDVDYDSEHFKGTLVDKTFTDEDMQAADHYVLSNGHDFVWVKDAGTLAAGKCWIELVPSSESHARTLEIVFDGDVTGISAVKTAATINGNCYDLSGRRVAQPTKGLFIVNGHKVVIK